MPVPEPTKRSGISRLADLVLVPQERVAGVFPIVLPLLKPALDWSGECGAAALQDRLLSGIYRLWLCHEGAGPIAAAVTEIVTTIRGPVCVLVLCGGSERHKWMGLLDEIETWAAMQGCKELRIYGRPGWTRVLPDYQVERVVLTKDLT